MQWHIQPRQCPAQLLRQQCSIHIWLVFLSSRVQRGGRCCLVHSAVQPYLACPLVHHCPLLAAARLLVSGLMLLSGQEGRDGLPGPRPHRGGALGGPADVASTRPEDLAFGGSSFGGIAALAAGLQGPDKCGFGALLVESPSLWIGPDEAFPG